MANKLTYSEVKSKVEDVGFKLLSKIYINNRTPLEVRCKNGHIKKSKLNNIIRRECKECYNSRVRCTLKDAQKLAEEKNGKCISEKYINTNTILKWQCEKGHIWAARLRNIKEDKWCPKCSSGKSERKLKKLLTKIFLNYTISQKYSNFPWLYNKLTRGTQHLDFVIFDQDNQPICAIEYDGEQHFKPVNFGGISDDRAKEKFKDTKRRDRRKNDLMKRHRATIPYFIRVNYKEKLTEKNIREILIKSGAIKC